MGRKTSRWVASLVMAVALAVSTVPAAQATPSTIGDAQLVAVDGNTLAHTIRYANGNWQRFGHLDAAGVGAVNSVIIGGQEHLFFDTRTELEHYIRHVDGTWDLAGSVPPISAAPPDTFSVTSLNGRLAMVRKQDTGALLSIQQADGSWSDWETVPFTPGIRDVSATADGGTLRVVALTDDHNSVLVENRSPDGTWSASPSKSVQVIGPPVLALAVTAAQVGTDLQVVVSYSFAGIHLWHTVLRADNTWTALGDIEKEGPAGDIPSVTDVAVAASTGGSLQVAASTEDGGIYHTIRYANGTWQHFGDVSSVAGPVDATRITLAADNG